MERFLREVLPDFQIVFILRDGRACTVSKVRRTGQTWEHAAYRWHYAVRVLKKLRELMRPVCVVRFEDLILNPQATLERVCDYLAIPFHTALLQQTESKCSCRIIEIQNLTGASWRCLNFLLTSWRFAF